MEWLLLLPLLVVVFPLVAATFAVGWWVAHRKRVQVEAVWPRYARARQMRYEAAAGEWPNRTSPSLHWSERDVAYRIEAGGAEGAFATRVVARPTVAALGMLTVTRPGDGGGEPLGTRLVVRDRPAGFARRVLTDDVRRRLLGFDLGGRVSLEYERGAVTLTWAGGELNDARLDEARALVAAVVAELLRGGQQP